MNTLEAEKLIGERFKKTGDYVGMYREHARLADYVWADTSRKDYEADLWYNHNRNEICLEMLGDLCKGKRVISIGGAHCIEEQFLSQITAGEVVRTDIIGNPEQGILEADAAALPFDAESFDVVICREVIEHVLDTDAVFAEIRRVLKANGHLLMTTPNAYTMCIDGVFHVRLYTPISFLQELQAQGFTVVKKRGNLPYILYGLMTYSAGGNQIALDDFKEIDQITKDYPERYYLSTQMSVLAQRQP